ncbi:hypothetical protein FRC10_007559 [Ceratobasidium sp. 414]|nr:hypothetical protein FRC10_007559 [Ceratobasidium sp. 414]
MIVVPTFFIRVASFALLPRSAASEQALASIISTSATMEQLPRSASYGESSHRVASGSSQGSSQRYPSSELSDRRRFARQGRSPRRENVLYSSSKTDVPFAPLSARAESPSSMVDSRPSTSSLRSNPSQYVLVSPERDAPFTGLVHLEQASAALASLHTPRSLPRSPAQSGYSGRHSMSRNKPSPPKLSIEVSNRRMETDPTFPCIINEPGFGYSRGPPRMDHARGPSPRTSPIKPAASPSETSLRNPAFDLISRVPPSLRIDVEQLSQQTKEEPYSAHDAGYSRTRSGPSPLFPVQPSSERDDRDSYPPPQQPSRAPVQYRHSISSSHPSSSYQTSRLLTIDEPRYSNTQRAEFQPSILDSSSHSLRYSDHSQRSQFGTSIRASSPSQTSTSIPSPNKVPIRHSHHSVTQSLHNFASSSSRKSVSPHTSSSSLPTSYTVDQDDEAFRVHPERAAISRMESMLMLSACRYEAEGQWSTGGGNQSANGYEVTGFGRDHARFSAGMNGFNGGPNQKAMTYLVYGPHRQEPSERLARTPPDTSYPFRTQAGPGSPNHPRTPGGTRGRQRSGSMHVLSPQRYGPPRHGSPPRQRQSHFQSPQRQRQRQRSASLMVHGLSPEAVKKLRVYETLKSREGERAESLREMVSVALPAGKQQAANREAKVKKSGRSPQGSKATLSPIEAATPIELSPTSLETGTIPSSSQLVGVSAAASPANIPLPPSPLHAFPLSPERIALPPLPVCSPELAPPPPQSPGAKEPASTISPLVSSESLMKYHVSQGIQSPRPMRTRQNTVSGRVVPTFRLISSPEKADRLVLGPRLGTTDGSHSQSEGGLDAPASRIDNLKPDPTIERILTPPPSFWSPPPLSAAVRTSVPLLPAAPAGPSRVLLRPMSVPPSGAGEAQLDGVRRAWSCEPPMNVEVRVGRSFAGDWSQCMVIDVSDDEGDLVTDASPSEDESELEDEVEAEIERGESRRKDLGGSRVGECLGEVVEMVERDEPGRDSADSVEYIRSGSGASKYYLSKGSSSSASASGVNAVEAVQSAIVKLAMDNAGLGRVQRMQAMQTKLSTTPPPSAGLVARYPVHSHRQQIQPLDYPQHSRTNQMQASINAYFNSPTVHVVCSHSQHGAHTKSNPTLDSLRSGLEKRIAASASAIEEAVRARSASPSLPNQTARSVNARSLPGPGPVLPPRLQRLHAMRAWTSPQLSLAQLEIPAFSQQPSSALPPALPRLPTSPMPSPVAPQQLATVPPSLPEPSSDNSTKQSPPLPATKSSASSVPLPQPGILPPASTDTKKERPPHLHGIVVGQTPVPPAPATAPLARSKRGKPDKRRSADGVSSKKHAGPSASKANPSGASSAKSNAPVIVKESATPNPSQPSGSGGSPPAKPKPRGKHPNRHPKSKKGVNPGKQATTPTPPGSAPAPVPVAPMPLPHPSSVPTNHVSPPPGTQENTVATKPARKKRYYKKSKTNKPGSTSTGS